ncbi:MAG TPA: hypothetical protein VHN98_08970 [Acidimicrobiales bacterium]|nr:hypothetical protein [Acidimicrobiales bacterium]
MAQPDYVPIAPGDRVREAERIPAPKAWKTDRPGEIVGLRVPEGDLFGSPGPDQGYGLLLAQQFADRLELEPGEHAEDAIAGCVPVAMKRSALYGRAPVVYDVEHAFILFGFLGGAPRDLLDTRKGLFEACADDYWARRQIVDIVPESTLRMRPAEVRAQLPGWRQLLNVEDDASEA